MRTGTAVLVCISLLVAFSPSAVAHAEPTAASPGRFQRLTLAPQEVWVRFSEPIDPHYTKVQIFGENGERVEAGTTHVSERNKATNRLTTNLSEGAYVLRWETYSIIDGHLSRGAWGFAVGNATPPMVGLLETPGFPTLAVVAKLAAYVGLALLLGLAMFVSRIQGEPGSYERRRELRNAGLVAAGLYAGGLLVWLVSQANDAQTTIASYARGTEYGESLVVRLVIALMAGAGLGFLSPGRNRLLLPVLLGPALWLHGQHSHAGAHLPPWGAALDALHLGAALSWAGGLVFLFWSLRSNRDPASRIAAALRFSGFAATAIGVTTVSGVLLALLVLGPPTNWYEAAQDTYGLVVLYKVLLAAAMIGLGAVNHFAYVRPFRRGTKTDALPLFRMNVRREAVNGLLVILLAAIVTNLSPPVDGAVDADGTTTPLGEAFEEGVADLAKTLTQTPKTLRTNPPPFGYLWGTP